MPDVLQSILALIAQARLEVPETEHDRQKRLQAKKARPVLPFVQLRSQLWLRETRRLRRQRGENAPTGVCR